MKAKSRPISLSQPHSMVTVIEKRVRASEKLIFLLASDLHMDHPKCKLDLLKADFDECRRRGGYILLNGDILCVMQGKYDKRHSKGNVRPEHMVDNYFDAIVDFAVEFLAPYADIILFMGLGNHETSILKRTETDLLMRIAERIYVKTGYKINLGQYHGWIYIKAIYGNSSADRRTQNTLSYKIYHNHGTGGEAPVTGGSIEDHRKLTQVEGADAIWMGHNHNKYARQQAVHYFDTKPNCMRPRMRIVEVIRTGTYKQEYTGAGWHIETNKAAKPLGGIWLELKTCCPHTRTKHLAPSITPTWHEAIDID